ncbi:MAG: tetratricopeptide repeat protein [Chitinophagales bacterium]
MKTLFLSLLILFTGLFSVNLHGQDDNAQKLYEKGMKAYEKGNYEQAMKYFVDAIEASEAFVESTYSYLGKSYYALQKQYSGLVDEKEFDTTYKVEGESPKVVKKEDSPDSDEKLVPEAAPKPSMDTDIIATNSAYQGGVAAYRQADYISAIQYFTLVIEAGEGNMSNALNYRGMSYHALGDYNAAIADYDSTIVLDEKSYIAFHNRGIAKQNSKFYNEALIDFNKTIRLNPTYSRAYESRAVLYYKMRELEKALDDCEKILELDANNKNALQLKEKLEAENE